jgi:cullin-4
VEYYASQANAYVDDSSTTEGLEKSPTGYIQWALEKVQEERERAKTCLDEKSAEMIVEYVRKDVGTNMQDRIVRRGTLLHYTRVGRDRRKES